MKTIISNTDCPFIIDILPGDNAIQTIIIRVCIQDYQEKEEVGGGNLTLPRKTNIQKILVLNP